jgi:hypothetical protein
MYIVTTINIWIFVNFLLLCKLIREVVFVANFIVVEYKAC